MHRILIIPETILDVKKCQKADLDFFNLDNRPDDIYFLSYIDEKTYFNLVRHNTFLTQCPITHLEAVLLDDNNGPSLSEKINIFKNKAIQTLTKLKNNLPDGSIFYGD